ncbi:MAG: hypothetical protein KC620_26525, partial [Myxococcales bacterium]|nr:hypothetical protein [Myxococcales bacterium]
RYLLDSAVVDPAGHQRDRHSGRSDIAVLRHDPTLDLLPGLGVDVSAPTAPDRRAVRARAERIQRLIRSGDGTRRLALAPAMLSPAQGPRALARALVGYRYDDIRAAETGRKRHDDLVSHAIDALGYYVAERRWQLDTPRLPELKLPPPRPSLWFQRTGGLPRLQRDFSRM